ncbi:MAG: hypothetical protein MZV49_05575 [Rhodopseudomonas palustris]|nr:hypothetical protein [Rhodopseudomonas palustris]
MKRAYDLPFASPRGLDHGLAYEAIARGQVDVIDIYSTDAKIDKYGLTVLADDRHFFPRYEAVLLHRADLPLRLPATWAAISKARGANRRRGHAAHERRGRTGGKRFRRGRRRIRRASFRRKRDDGIARRRAQRSLAQAVRAGFHAAWGRASRAGVRLARGKRRARPAAGHPRRQTPHDPRA